LTTKRISTTSLRATVARSLRRLARSSTRSTRHLRPSSNNQSRNHSVLHHKRRHQRHLEVLGSTLRHLSPLPRAADTPPNRSPHRLRRTGNLLNILHPLVDTVPRNLQAFPTMHRRMSDSRAPTTHSQHQCEMAHLTLPTLFTRPSG
jgi:hypothetical protein